MTKYIIGHRSVRTDLYGNVLLQRMSGIAAYTRNAADLLSGSKTKLLFLV